MTWRAAVGVVLVSCATLAPALAQELDLARLSPQQMLDDADARIAQMERAVDDVHARRDQTQSQERDLTKVRCINDKIAAMQGFLRLSADSRASLAEQVGRGDRDAIEHQYTLVVIASQRVGNLQGQAAQCAGDILTFAGDTEQSATVDPDIPDVNAANDDVANALLDRLTPDSPLPEATPFQ
jgi:hypothetical protein